MDIATFTTQLDQNTKDTLQLAANCSPAELAYKPEDRWSIQEILEHICLTDRAVAHIISKPSENLHTEGAIYGSEKLERMMVGMRARKAAAPDVLKPKGNIKDIASFETTFVQQREHLKKELMAGRITIDNRIHQHPGLGAMTISDWLNFLIHHTQRHLEQINDFRGMMAG